MKKRIFIQSIFPAPYRVSVFKELAEMYDIFVVFERNNDNNRSSEWFVKNVGFDSIVLDSQGARKKYQEEISKINKYDIVLAYDYSTVSSMKLMIKCMIHGIPYIINCDGAFINKNFIKAIVKRFFVTNAKLCFASGVYAENYFFKLGAKKKSIVRHNFSSLHKSDILKELVPIEEKQRLRVKLGLPSDKKIVLSIGQFAHRKGFDILLHAWKQIGDKSLLILIGGGEKEKEYRDIISKYEIKNVIIQGFKQKGILFDYYKTSDLFVLPTREDIWGLVINEAMACGLPIITTNRCIAGLELINDGENGFIVPNENIDDLAKCIKMIMEDDKLSLQMGKENLNKICGYNVEDIAKSHIEVLEKIIGDK